MKKITRIVVAFGMALLLVLNSCQQGANDYSQAVQMIPQDASMVMCVDVQSLDDKMPEGSVDISQLVDSKDVDSDILRMYFNDSLKTGISKQELVLFASVNEQLGMSVLLEDADVFQQFIEDAIRETECVVSIQKTEDYKYCVIDSVCLLWDASKALLLANSNQEIASALFMQSQSSSVIANDEFKSFYAEHKEISLWVNMEGQMDLLKFLPPFKQGMALPSMDQYAEMYKGLYSSSYVEFLDGEVLVTSKVSPEKPARELIAKFYNGKPSQKLLEAIPAESFLLLSGALNLPEFLKIYNGIPQMKELLEDPDTKKIINSLKGDVVLSICGFASGPMPIPNAVIGLTVEDESLLQSIKSIEGVQKLEKDGYTVLTVALFQVFVAQREDMVLVSTDEDVIKTFAEGRELENNLTNSDHKIVLSSAGYYYLNLDLNTYPAFLTTMLQSKMGQSYNEISSSLNISELYGFYDASDNNSELHLVFKNKEKNSLTAIVEMINGVIALSK